MEKIEEEKKGLTENIFEQLTVRDFLINEYNKHLALYVQNLIELTFTAGRPQDEIVVILIQPSGNPNVPGIERKIKAREAQMNARNKIDKQESILRAIQKLISQENKNVTKFE